MAERPVSPRRRRASRALVETLSQSPPPHLEVIDVSISDDFVVFRWSESDTEPHSLSDGLRDVLRGLVRGESNAEIAKRRRRSVRTVANQVALLLRRYGARSRVELVGIVGRSGVEEPPLPGSPSVAKRGAKRSRPSRRER